MCNQYAPADPEIVEAYFKAPLIGEPYKPGIGPWGKGPFVRATSDGREAVVGQWALIGDGATEAKSSARVMTNNARSETVSTKLTFRGPWSRGQRCLIPAASFLEPNWESQKNVWWRFSRADGDPWGLAGIWNTWTDKETGEIVESYTMLTMNADSHPLMNRMHRPDTNLPIDKQDKRSVVVIEPTDFDLWLKGNQVEVMPLIRLAPVEVFSAHPDQKPT